MDVKRSMLVLTGGAGAVAVVAAIVVGAVGDPEITVDDPVTDVLEVSCAEHGTVVTTPRVRAQPDGVHLRIVALPGDGTSVELAGSEVERRGGAHRAGDSVIDTVGPGDVLVRCYPDGGPRHFLSAADDPESVAIEIVDADGHWRDPGDLECRTDLVQSTIYDYAADETIDDREEKPPLEVVASERFAQPGGEIEIAGYEQADRRWVRLSQDGRVVALARYSNEGGTWVVHSIHACADT